MGKVEKVIVLSVLFLVALILGVTLMVDDPLDKSNVVEVGARTGPPVVAQAPAPAPAGAPTAGAPLLNAAVQPAAVPTATPAAVQPPVAATTTAPAAAVPQQPAAPTQAAPAVAAPGVAALPPGALLKSTDGLQDSWFPDLKLYTWREGDSWRVLADRFYGDWKRLDVLKRHNEGRMDVQPGDTVFVPVFADERARTAAMAPASVEGGAAPEVASKPVAAKSGKGEPKTAAKAAAPSGKKFHVVTNGESLWKIAKAELGDGNRWKEIYEANRDLLDKPESIKKGMRLRIP